MVQYILENVISFGIGLTFIISTLILGFYFLVRASKRTGQERFTPLAFGLALLAFAGAHIIWNLRAAFFPQYSLASWWFLYWQGFWILFMTGIAFLGLWSLFLAYPNWFKTKKWFILVLLIPWLVVIVDVLLITNPVFAEIVCSARIWDIGPDLIIILTAALSLTLYIGLALDYYYGQFKTGVNRFQIYLILTGLILLLVGGILDCKAIPICEVITVGRVLMLGGIWLTSIALIRLNSQPSKE